MVWAIEARLPSPHSQLPLVRSGPWGLPLAPVPWHPVHGALATWPSKIRPQRATAPGVDPAGVGRAACAPASGWMPSGGTAAPAARLSARDGGVGAAATAAVGGP